MAITERRLSAILAADVCNFSTMMGENEDRTVENLRTCRELIEGSITSHKGNIFNTAGDSIVAEFGSVVDAVNCAVSFQETLRDRNGSVLEESKMEFRVGINLGDIIIEGDNRYGDGINIAARLEGLSEPGGICISGSVYSDIKSKLNLEFGAMGEQVLKNIAQPVSAYKIDFRGDGPVPMASIGELDKTPITQLEQGTITILETSAKPKQKQSEKPSIAVLPFDNMSSDGELEYFTDGVTEDIITEVSKFRFLNVIARNSVFVYKGQSPDITQVGKDLNARYVVEGSVRKSGNRARVNVQLIKGDTGGHLWAERFEKEVEDIFDLQDQIVDTVSKGLNLALLDAERNLAMTMPEEEMGAWEFTHRANWHFWRHQKEDFKEAIRFANKSLEIDENNSIAWAVKGVAGDTSDFLGYSNDGLDNIGFLKKSIELAPTDALCHAYLGHVYNSKGDQQNAIACYKKSLSFNPNLQFALMGLGWVLVFSDQFLEGRNYLEKAVEISDNSPITGRVYIALSMSYFGEENNNEAVKWINQAVVMNSQFPAKLIRIVIQHNLGNNEEANDLKESFNNEYPDVSIKVWWDRWPRKGFVIEKLGKGLIDLGLL